MISDQKEARKTVSVIDNSILITDLAENSTGTQNLIVTVQSRLRVDIDYKLFLTHLDRSQYDLKFKPGQSEKTLQNQKLTFVKPMGFFLDAKEQDVKSFHITVTSEDDICANVITVPANVRLTHWSHRNFKF